MRTHRYLAGAFLVATLGLSCPSLAVADVGPAQPCPVGMTSGYYRGRYCAPVACQTNGDCADGASCEERAFCLGTRTNADTNATIEVYQGTCEGGQACDANATCAQRRFCGPPSGTVEETQTKDCGVVTPGASTPTSMLALGIAVLLLVRRSRRGAR